MDGVIAYCADTMSRIGREREREGFFLVEDHGWNRGGACTHAPHLPLWHIPYFP